MEHTVFRNTYLARLRPTSQAGFPNEPNDGDPTAFGNVNSAFTLRTHKL